MKLTKEGQALMTLDRVLNSLIELNKATYLASSTKINGSFLVRFDLSQYQSDTNEIFQGKRLISFLINIQSEKYKQAVENKAFDKKVEIIDNGLQIRHNFNLLKCITRKSNDINFSVPWIIRNIIGDNPTSSIEVEVELNNNEHIILKFSRSSEIIDNWKPK
jgi:hypothetical protein